eukprot:2409070-Prymnesium_polylepis.1
MRPPQYRLSSLSLRKCRSWKGAQPRPRAARRLAAFGLSHPLWERAVGSREGGESVALARRAARC